MAWYKGLYTPLLVENEHQLHLHWFLQRYQYSIHHKYWALLLTWPYIKLHYYSGLVVVATMVNLSFVAGQFLTIKGTDLPLSGSLFSEVDRSWLLIFHQQLSLFLPRNGWELTSTYKILENKHLSQNFWKPKNKNLVKWFFGYIYIYILGSKICWTCVVV